MDLSERLILMTVCRLVRLLVGIDGQKKNIILTLMRLKGYVVSNMERKIINKKLITKARQCGTPIFTQVLFLKSMERKTCSPMGKLKIRRLIVRFLDRVGMEWQKRKNS